MLRRGGVDGYDVANNGTNARAKHNARCDVASASEKHCHVGRARRCVGVTRADDASRLPTGARRKQLATLERLTTRQVCDEKKRAVATKKEPFIEY